MGGWWVGAQCKNHNSSCSKIRSDQSRAWAAGAELVNIKIIQTKCTFRIVSSLSSYFQHDIPHSFPGQQVVQNLKMNPTSSEKLSQLFESLICRAAQLLGMKSLHYCLEDWKIEGGRWAFYLYQNGPLSLVEVPPGFALIGRDHGCPLLTRKGLCNEIPTFQGICCL